MTLARFLARADNRLHLGRNVGATLAAYTGRFFRKGASEAGCVILSAAKDLRLARREILRCAQDDSLWRPAHFKKPTRVSTPPPRQGQSPDPVEKHLHIGLVKVFISGQRQELNELVIGNDRVEYLICRLKFVPGKLLLSIGHPNFLQFILCQFPE